MNLTFGFSLLSLFVLVGSIPVLASNNLSKVYAQTVDEEYSFVKKWGASLADRKEVK
jgi:hypothetical protein